MRTSSLYEKCHELFIGYPLAASAVDGERTVRSMVLMLRDEDDAEFFVLSHHCGEGRSFYSLCPWPAGTIVDIEADGSAPVPDAVVSAVTHGVPIPQDGSLFGWKRQDAVTALIAVYAEHTPTSPEPCWSVMPRAGIPETQWPPFTGEPLIGNWFWELQQAGKIVFVGGLIAGIPGTVFWADTESIIGSDCCVVARDVRSPEGYTLPSGRYVYYKALRAGGPVPSLQELLADTDKTDLAPRFQSPTLAGQGLEN